jgi:protein-S-isoprenylcysteine O-methyltransferase Ste14
MVALVAIPLAAILVRIRVEEAELAAALGAQYTSYANRARRLVPGLW